MDPNPQFPLTPWTTLRQAVGQDPTADRMAAINEICLHYWYPLYAFARWKGCSHQDAEDQTQVFLSRLIERRSLEHADASKGRLRTYLLSGFQHQLINHWERNQAVRRGGSTNIEQLNMGGANDRFEHEIQDPALSPENQFDRAWGLAVLDACLAEMASTQQRSGHGETFATLRPFLNPSSVADASMKETAAKLGLSETALRQRIFRLRAEFSRALRAHVARLLCYPTPDLIEEEMQSLRHALERG